MIQRIQTVFMLLFVLAGGVNFFLFPSEIIVFEPLLGENVDASPYFSILLSFLVLINIGFYKRRMLQLRINQLAWVLYTLFWGSFVYMIIRYHANSFYQFLPDLLIAFLGEVFLLLANRFIRKDEALIRSLDRLR
ncbi:MAG: DUF4293 family protein [Flavobacteriaceae bacterium]